MRRTAASFGLIAALLHAQSAQAPDLESQAAALRALVERTPRASLKSERVALQPPRPAWEIGYPSAVAMDDFGALYILQAR